MGRGKCANLYMGSSYCDGLVVVVWGVSVDTTI